MTRGSGGAWRPRRGSLSAAAASRLLRVEGHDRRGRAVDAAGNSSRCRVPTLIYPRRGGDRDDSLDFSPSGRRSPVTGKLEMPVVAASLAGNTIKRYKNLSLMRNPRHLGTSDIEKLYDKLRYSKFVKEHSSSCIFSSLFQLKSREPGTLHSVQPLPCFMGRDHSAVPISSLDLSSNVVSPGDQIIRMRDEILHIPTDVEGVSCLLQQTIHGCADRRSN
uniref:Uncharacterized protein n=1 Tax=Oryza rufipogon TaxID=4529 RepID=A0A0E0QPQ0_ORYRU